MNNLNEDIVEQINLYLSGQMTSEESAAFEQRIREDEALAEWVELQKGAHWLVIGDHLNHVKEMMDQDFKSGQVKTGKSGNATWWISGLVITVLFSILIALIYEDKPESFVPKRARRTEQRVISPDKNKKEGKKDEVKTDSHYQVTRPQTTWNILNPDGKTHSKAKPDLPIKNTAYTPPFDPSNQALITGKMETESTSQPEPISIKEEKKMSLDSADQKPEIKTNVGKEQVTNTKDTLENTNPVLDSGSRYTNSFSFKPEFGEVFTIPMNKGTEGEIRILDRAGNKVYTEKIYVDRVNTWNGMNLQGGISPSGLYIYSIEYTNGQKEFGQIIIY